MSSSSRGRGGFTPYRGRGGRGNILAQHGNRTLISENISGSSSQNNNSDKLYQEFLEYKKIKGKAKATGEIPSYANVVISEEEDITSYQENEKQGIIFLIEYDDYIKKKNDPWSLMEKYLDNNPFASTVYKQRSYYENILKASECEITHFMANDQKEYTFSKIIIKRIYLPNEWGLSLFKEKEYLFQEKNISIKYNYWDYIQAFTNVFLYENRKQKHTWFVKVCPEVYKHLEYIPNWFQQWWLIHGPSIKILPEEFKELYLHWVDISPKISDLNEQGHLIECSGSLHFFLEFSIPWILKWSPIVDISTDNLPCLKRKYFSKFWTKLSKKDPQTGQIFGDELFQEITAKISYLEELTDEQLEDACNRSIQSPLKNLTGKLKIKGIVSKQEILSEFMKEIKKDLLKNFGFNSCSFADLKSDTSMASSTNMAEDAQDPNIDIDQDVHHFMKQLEELEKEKIDED